MDLTCQPTIAAEDQPDYPVADPQIQGIWCASFNVAVKQRIASQVVFFKAINFGVDYIFAVFVKIVLAVVMLHASF